MTAFGAPSCCHLLRSRASGEQSGESGPGVCVCLLGPPRAALRVSARAAGRLSAVLSMKFELSCEYRNCLCEYVFTNDLNIEIIIPERGEAGCPHTHAAPRARVCHTPQPGGVKQLT